MPNLLPVQWLPCVFLLLSLPLFPLQAQQPVANDANPVALEDIVVTSERMPVAASSANSPTHVVDSAAIRGEAPTDLTQVLRNVTGVQVDPVVGSGAGVILQGLGSDRVMVLLDGAPVQGRLGGQFDLSRIPPGMIQRIEIVEGPQSTLFGSAALGGVVNLISRQDTAPHLDATAQMGSFNQRDVSVGAGGSAGATNAALVLGRRTSDLVPGTSSTVAGNADRWDGLARVGTETGGIRADARVMGIRERQMYHAATAPGSHSFNDNWQFDELVSLHFDRAPNTELRLHGSQYNHRFTRAASTTPDYSTADTDHQRVLDAELLQRGHLGSHRWLAGGKLERESIQSVRLDGGARAAWSGALFGDVEWRAASWLNVTTGARYTDAEVWGANVSPRVAVRAALPEGFYVRAAGARGFRAPSFKEQYTDFTNTGSGPSYTVLGNTSLRPESSWNLNAEAGVMRGSSKVYVRAYRNWLRDLIETVLIDPATTTFRYENVERAHTHGLEAGSTAQAGPVSLSAAHAWLGATDDESGEQLSGRAAHTTKVTGTVELPHDASLSSSVIHTSSVPITARGGTEWQAAYARVNLSLAAPLVEGADVVIGVDNVTDTRPEGAITNLGRRWFTALHWRGAW
ncbi:MAG TPA: TonB-dependent receptor [Gemmatimonadales bacterium]|jgi:outer membrane cobalamin receptor|nr:TonB-dependent receptor [Gemmatimonadales bacterium]